MDFARRANNFFSYLTANQPDTQTPAPGSGEVEEIEDDDLDINRYISPPSRRRIPRPSQQSSQLSQPGQEGTPRMSRPEGRTIRYSSAGYRSERQNGLMKPRAGDSHRGQGGTPLSQPGAYRPPPRGPNVIGPVRPRNDLVAGSLEKASVKIPAGYTGRSGEDQHDAKRRKIAEKIQEGDGFQRGLSVDSSGEADYTRTSRSTRSENRTPLDVRKVIKRQFASVDDSAEEVSEVETGSANTTIRRKERKSPYFKNGSRSERSSPDPLGAASDPVESYEEVQHLRKPTYPDSARQQMPLPRSKGFGLTLFRNSKLELNSTHGLQLIPQKSRGTYSLFKHGQDTGYKLRLKSLECGYRHRNSHLVILKTAQTASEAEFSVFRFSAMRDHYAFFEDIEDQNSQDTIDKMVEVSDVHELEEAASMDLKTSIFDFDRAYDERNGKRRLQTKKYQGKLIHKLQDSSGEPQYRHGTIDQTLESARRAEKPARRSMRRPRPVEKATDVHRLDNDATEVPDVPEIKKYSEEHGLPKQWKQPLIYPSIGKNRATVNWDDLFKLDEGEMLNDNLVNFYLRFLETRLQASNPDAAKRVYWFNTYFYATLLSNRKSTQINYEAVKKWTRNIDLFSYDYVVVPIVERLHWYVAIICNISSINRVVPDFVESPGSKSDDGADAPEKLSGEKHEDTAEAAAEMNDAESHIKVDAEFKGGTTGAATAEEDIDTVKSPQAMGQAAGVNETTILEHAAKPETPPPATMVADSQSSIDSLVAGKCATPPEVPPSYNNKSIEQIFGTFSEDEDQHDQASRPPTGNSANETMMFQSFMQDLEQNSKMSNGSIPRICDDTSPHPSISKAEEVSPGEERAETDQSVSKEDEIALLPESPQAEVITQQARKNTVRKKGKPGHLVRRFDPKKPAIVTLDSFGHAHPATAKLLKQYLGSEAYDKRGRMEINTQEIQGITGTGIPVQQNFCDCGLYLLGYMEKFVDNPTDLVTQLLQKSLDSVKDWPQLDASSMRNELRTLLQEKYEEQMGIRKEVKDSDEPAKAAASQLNRLSNPSAITSQERQLLHNKTESDALPADVPSESRPPIIDDPVTRTEALATAQELEETGDQSSVLSDLVDNGAEQEAGDGDGETEEKEAYQYLDDDATADDSRKVEIKVPRYNPPSNTRTVMDMPTDSPKEESASEPESGPPQASSPPRPKSRGKSLASSRVKIELVTKPSSRLRLKDKRSRPKVPETIVLDD